MISLEGGNGAIIMENPLYDGGHQTSEIRKR